MQITISTPNKVNPIELHKFIEAKIEELGYTKAKLYLLVVHSVSIAAQHPPSLN